MKQAIGETSRRRAAQLEYNKANKITPQTIRKAINTTLADQLQARKIAAAAIHAGDGELDRMEAIAELEREMLAAADELDFERAARARDRIEELKGD